MFFIIRPYEEIVVIEEIREDAITSASILRGHAFGIQSQVEIHLTQA